MTWLRADLILRRRQARSEEAAQRRLAAAKLLWWLKDTNLKGVRPGPDRTLMPEAEVAAWDKLWDDVKATIDLAQKAPVATPTE